MLSEKQQSPAFEEHLAIVRNVLLDLEILISEEEVREEVAKKHDNPLQKALSRFNFVQEKISPILSGLDGDYESCLRVPLGSFESDNPSEVVIYNGIAMYICSYPVNFKEDLTHAKKITEKSLRDLHGQGSGEMEAICAFGRMSNKDIILEVKNAVKTMESLDLPNISISAEHHDSLKNTIKNIFTGEKSK